MTTQLPPQTRENTVYIRSRIANESIKNYVEKAAGKLFMGNLSVVYLSGMGSAIPDVVNTAEVLKRLCKVNQVYGSIGTVRFEEQSRSSSKLIIGLSKEKLNPVYSGLTPEIVKESKEKS
jgi:hypothetical protein